MRQLTDELIFYKEIFMNSSLYLELSKEELRKLISETLNTDINSAKLLTGGLFNTTYYIDTMKYG